MQQSTSQRSLVGQALWLLRARPAHVLRATRSYLSFWMAELRRRLPGGIPAGITLDRNVRLQRNRSLMAEVPNGRITIGEHTVVYEDARIEAYGGGQVSIGKSSIIGGARIVSRYGVRAGDRLLTSWNVFIQDFDSHPTDFRERSRQVETMVADFLPHFVQPMPAPQGGRFANWTFPGEPIVIGDDVWIGANATILKGAQIGDGCIIATGAVVLRGTYPANAVIAGNPAVVVKLVTSEDASGR